MQEVWSSERGWALTCRKSIQHAGSTCRNPNCWKTASAFRVDQLTVSLGGSCFCLLFLAFLGLLAQAVGSSEERRRLVQIAKQAGRDAAATVPQADVSLSLSLSLSPLPSWGYTHLHTHTDIHIYTQAYTIYTYLFIGCFV